MRLGKPAWCGVWAGLSLLFLSGCDQLGLETPAQVSARQVEEAKAVGGACRHAMRAIEDCYALNAKADKSSIFAGWREMDEYMRENKLEGIAPQIPRATTGSAATKARRDSAQDEEYEEELDEAPGPSRAKRGASAPASSAALNASEDKPASNAFTPSARQPGRSTTGPAASGDSKDSGAASRGAADEAG